MMMIMRWDVSISIKVRIAAVVVVECAMLAPKIREAHAVHIRT